MAGCLPDAGTTARTSVDPREASSHDLGAVETARLLAVLNTAQADAFIACWDAKFAYWSERPVTAIRRQFEPGWLPYIATPPSSASWRRRSGTTLLLRASRDR
jgi:hypothetical protein